MDITLRMLPAVRHLSSDDRAYFLVRMTAFMPPSDSSPDSRTNFLSITYWCAAVTLLHFSTYGCNQALTSADSFSSNISGGPFWSVNDSRSRSFSSGMVLA